MEGGKQSGTSLASDLFGAKDPSQQTTSVGNFPTIFPKVMGQEPFQYLETDKKISSENPPWTSKNGVSGHEEQLQSSTSKDKVLPFHYNSSIYYGGQDDYTPSESARKSATTFNKDGGEEDLSDSSSIRSWWQGSVYY